MFRDLKWTLRHYSSYLPKYGIPYSGHQFDRELVELGALGHGSIFLEFWAAKAGVWYGVGGGRWLIKVNKYCTIHVITNFRPDTDFLPDAEVIYYHFAVTLHRHVVLIPNKSIYVLQGQSGEVTCEAEGPSDSTLKWEKQQDDQSYAAVPNSQVNITKDTKYVRAVLKITNAQLADTGIYKCTVSVPPNKSDFRLINIDVKGMFVLYFIVKATCTFIASISSFLQYMAQRPAH